VAYARSQGAEVWKAEAAGDRHAAWKRALHWISLIEEKTSGNDALRMEDARMRRRLNDYDAALSRLSGLRDTPELLRLRGQIRFEKAFERTKDPEQLKAALTDFDAAVRMNPGGALELFWRGTCQHALTDTARAMEDLQASRKLGLDSPDLHYQLSKLQLGLKAFPLAAEQAGAALGQSDSLTEEGYVANLFEQRGLSRSAGIRLLECEVLLCRASAEFALSDYKACSRDCTRILGSDPQNLKAFILRGEAACRDNRHADAQKDFEMAVTVASSEKEKVDATQRRESCLGHSK
jgi:tetratricopeptide (TPR) repeat protein